MPIQFSNTTTHSPVFDNLSFLDHPSSSTFRILSTVPFCLAVPPWPEAGESKGSLQPTNSFSCLASSVQGVTHKKGPCCGKLKGGLWSSFLTAI